MDILFVLTDAGREYEIDQLIAGSPMVLSRFRVGTGGDGYVPTETQTDLNTEIAIDFTDIILTKISATVYSITCHLPLGAGFEDTISEVGVFADSGALFGYGVFDPTPKNNSNEFDMIATLEL